MRRPRGDVVRRRATVVGFVLVAAVLVISTGASGSSLIKGQTTGSEQLTAGGWGASASPTSLTWNLLGGSQFSTVSNTGTVALAHITYTVTISAGLGVTTFTLAACTVAWSGGLCSGGAGSAIGGSYAINSTTNVTSSVVPPVSGNVYLKATASGVTVTSISMTLGLAVTGSSTPASTQLRSAVTTNQ
jgi:hypothetical protein